VIEQERGDVLAAHMGGSAKRRLEVAAAPVPNGVDETRLATQELLHPPKIAMRLGDEFLHQAGIECGFLVHALCLPGDHLDNQGPFDGRRFEIVARTMKLDDAILQELKARYAEPHRAYHTWKHVEDMLGRLPPIAGRLSDRDAFELAILFHDAVYDPKAGDNEEQSAALMRRELAGRVPPTVLDAAEALILATKTHRPGAHADAPFLIDIDLAILGAPAAAFDAYDAAIRKEYAHVPDAAYRTGRTKVLRTFLDRERIFLTAAFAPLEACARDNLKRAIAQLAQ
jgi:predicted metal-dependent HD superfamily phosphohydrolase